MVTRGSKIVGFLSMRDVMHHELAVKTEEIDHIYEPHFHFGQKLAEQRNGSQRFHGRQVAATRHDYIGLDALVVARPIPDTGAFGAVDDRGFGVQVLQMHLFVGDDDVDVVDALQAVISDREQAIGVGRQVDTDNVRTLVGDHIEEAGILVREAVVILAPDQPGD